MTTANDNANEKRNYRYTNENGVLWAEPSILTLTFRKETSKNFIELMLKISPLVDKKKVKLEGNKYDEGFFAMSTAELPMLLHGIDLLERGERTQFEISHISKEGTGTQFEIMRGEDDAFYANILVYDNGEPTSDYTYKFARPKAFMTDVDPDTGEGTKETIVSDLIVFRECIRHAIATTSGLFGASLAMCIDYSSNSGSQRANEPQGIVKNRKKKVLAAKDEDGGSSKPKAEKRDVNKLFQDEEEE